MASLLWRSHNHKSKRDTVSVWSRSRKGQNDDDSTREMDERFVQRKLRELQEQLVVTVGVSRTSVCTGARRWIAEMERADMEDRVIESCDHIRSTVENFVEMHRRPSLRGTFFRSLQERPVFTDAHEADPNKIMVYCSNAWSGGDVPDIVRTQEFQFCVREFQTGLEHVCATVNRTDDRMVRDLHAWMVGNHEHAPAENITPSNSSITHKERAALLKLRRCTINVIVVMCHSLFKLVSLSRSFDNDLQELVTFQMKRSSSLQLREMKDEDIYGLYRALLPDTDRNRRIIQQAWRAQIDFRLVVSRSVFRTCMRLWVRSCELGQDLNALTLGFPNAHGIAAASVVLSIEERRSKLVPIENTALSARMSMDGLDLDAMREREWQLWNAKEKTGLCQMYHEVIAYYESIADGNGKEKDGDPYDPIRDVSPVSFRYCRDESHQSQQQQPYPQHPRVQEGEEEDVEIMSRIDAELEQELEQEREEMMRKSDAMEQQQNALPSAHCRWWFSVDDDDDDQSAAVMAKRQRK